MGSPFPSDMAPFSRHSRESHTAPIAFQNSSVVLWYATLRSGFCHLSVHNNPRVWNRKAL